MSKKSLATFVGNCNQPPKENNLYKQVPLRVTFLLWPIYGSFICFFKKCIEKVLLPILKLDFDFRNLVVHYKYNNCK